jgi:hypothetical protein
LWRPTQCLAPIVKINKLLCRTVAWFKISSISYQKRGSFRLKTGCCMFVWRFQNLKPRNCVSRLLGNEEVYCYQGIAKNCKKF